MTPTLRVSISGVDGTGKTTLIRRLKETYLHRPTEIYAFRSPQFHEDPCLPQGALSQIIEELSVHADLTQNPVLKSLALFLSMSLYGDAERYILSAFHPEVVVGERQCVLDTLAYGQYYLPLLAQSSSASQSVRPQVVELLGRDQAAFLETWLGVVGRREPGVLGVLNLDTVVPFMIRVCQGPPDEVVRRLLRIYHSDLPDQIILLSTSPEDLAHRLASKRTETPVMEIHERLESLMGLSAALVKTAEFLKSFKPSLKIKILNTENLNVDQSIQNVLRVIL